MTSLARAPRRARLGCQTLSDERALALVSRQGFGTPKAFGPRAPTTVKTLLGFLRAAQVRG